MMPRLRVDTGAIKFVLSGANIMCPGLTSPGATIHDEVGMKIVRWRLRRHVWESGSAGVFGGVWRQVQLGVEHRSAALLVSLLLLLLPGCRCWLAGWLAG
jgi:hypothetical protein